MRRASERERALLALLEMVRELGGRNTGALHELKERLRAARVPIPRPRRSHVVTRTQLGNRRARGQVRAGGR